MHFLSQRTLVKTCVWILAEILLSGLGTDNLADYSEYIFERDITAVSHPIEVVSQASF